MNFDDKNLDGYCACEGCDLLLLNTHPPAGHSSRCPRCNNAIKKGTTNSIVKTLALSIAGLILYLPAIWLPLMTLESFGFKESANIIESIVNFYLNGYYFVAFMVLISACILPLLLLSLIAFISLQLRLGRYPPYLAKLFKTYLLIEEWAMVEVYLLGIMVTIIKMTDTSDIYYQSGIFCFSALVIVNMAVSTTIDKDFFWRLIEKGKKQEQPVHSINSSIPEKEHVTAADLDLVLCHVCHKLSPSSQSSCTRCSTKLHRRKPKSIARTWALVLTAMILLIPANTLPIMRVDFLGIPDKSTILDGIIYFFEDGSYFIGFIIFAASILVPVFKVVGLTILLLPQRPCSQKALRQKTKMFRFIAFIGRWSMLDIFVIALLTVLVDFGFFSSVHAAPAATYFCLVVAATMLAATTFDPRIMWDRCSPTHQDKL